MAHTNSTTHYALPQFLSTDKPAWLTDVNPAYATIDAGMHAAQAAADAAQGDATQALDDAAAAAGTATTADSKGSGAIASIAATFDSTATYNVGDYVIYNNLLYKCFAAVTTPGPWTGSTNWNRETLSAAITNITIDSIGDINDVDLTGVQAGDMMEFVTDGLGGLKLVPVGVEQVAITKSISSRGSIECYRLGKMVLVMININTDSVNPPAGTELARNLPVPLAYQGFYPRLEARTAGGSYIQDIVIDNNGIIKTIDTTMDGGRWWAAQIFYFSA